MSVRTWMLRRLTRRTGATSNVEVDLQIGPDWVRPYWLERQLDPASPAFVPQGHLPFLANITHRNWTAVGNLDSPREAIVDPRGLVTPWFDGWSLDWWIGAEDRWHLPSREVAVRQRLVGASPVVETAMSIPSGDAVQRVYAVRRSSADGGGELIVVEIENLSKAPVALALAVRPYTPEGTAPVERIDLRGGAVAVDGRVALLLPKPPMRVARSTFREGDSAETVLAGEAGERWTGPVHDALALAQAAFVYPLAHGATFRAAIPLVPEPRTRRRSVAHRRLVAAPSFPDVLPPAEAVAKGWQSQSDRGMRLVLPDDRLAEAVAANRRFLLLLHDGDAITHSPATDRRFRFRDICYLLGALDRYGYHDEVARVLASYPGRQRIDGSFSSRPHEGDATGAALVSLAQHSRLTRDAELVDAMVGPIAKAVHSIDTAWRAAKGSTADDASWDHAWWDDFWGVAGLRAGAELLRAIDQPEAAEDAERFAAAMWADVEASLARTADRLGTQAMPAGPRRRVDAGAIGSLVACAPLGLLTPDDARIAGTADVIRDRFTLAEGRAVYQGIGRSGLGTHLTLRLAAVELRAGDRRCLDRLDWMLDAATPTWTWPESIHPRLDGGCAGDGHHGWTAAELLTFVRDLLVREVDGGDGADGGLALSSLVPGGWYGQGWEVHDAPTAHGRISYAVRWHGDRVALLWEVDAHEGVGLIRLTAPGLDPSWSTTDRRGEALLGPVPAPEAPHGADDVPPAARAGDAADSPVPMPSPEGGSFS